MMWKSDAQLRLGMLQLGIPSPPRYFSLDETVKVSQTSRQALDSMLANGAVLYEDTDSCYRDYHDGF